ncbi:type I-MYXAN CRISPR-associated protein Cas6/Cmx6 [candidate division WOR-3 bacterium]|uniref:Type I-MYXAN CRISPR-associated protein Cas6/Cmx6 n=1 Tax=candidate division WOR-3 bacterium TaxID=2052148 RepID=A0A938BUN4_UNCW3|nr:type I-MYXAN CRISPR-associated protein Cas6/Cmx6 [candidate division WOR-3 bacterium]
MPITEMSFRLRGTPLPQDHGYQLYRAVAGVVPWMAEPAQMGVALVPIQGSPHGGFLHLTTTSRLAFRLNAEDAERLLPLSDRTLVVEAATLRLGSPTEYRLRPVPGLASPFVVAERCRYSDEVLEWLKREFLTLDIKAMPTLRPRRGRKGADPDKQGRRSFVCPYERHIRHIDGRSVIGWEIQVFGLSPAESLRLQEQGVGPGRRYGCGVFAPVEGERPRRTPKLGPTGVWFPPS